MNFYYLFINITNKIRNKLRAIILEPEEIRQKEYYLTRVTFRLEGTNSLFKLNISRLKIVTKDFKNNPFSLTATGKELVINNLAIRGYNPKRLTFKLITYISLSLAVFTSGF